MVVDISDLARAVGDGLEPSLVASARATSVLPTRRIERARFGRLSTSGRFWPYRLGTIVTITGRVEHRWFDRYDWHARARASLVPGVGRFYELPRKLVPYIVEGTSGGAAVAVG